jgi:hypothetical protein
MAENRLGVPRLETFPAIPTIFLPYLKWVLQARGEKETRPQRRRPPLRLRLTESPSLNDLSREVHLPEWVGKFGPIAELDEAG